MFLVVTRDSIRRCVRPSVGLSVGVYKVVHFWPLRIFHFFIATFSVQVHIADLCINGLVVDAGGLLVLFFPVVVFIFDFVT